MIEVFVLPPDFDHDNATGQFWQVVKFIIKRNLNVLLSHHSHDHTEVNFASLSFIQAMKCSELLGESDWLHHLFFWRDSWSLENEPGAEFRIPEASGTLCSFIVLCPVVELNNPLASQVVCEGGGFKKTGQVYLLIFKLFLLMVALDFCGFYISHLLNVMFIVWSTGST